MGTVHRPFLVRGDKGKESYDMYRRRGIMTFEQNGIMVKSEARRL